MLTLTLNLSEENYFMTLEKLCPGQGQFKHLTFNCDLDLGHIETNFSQGTST